MSLPHRRQPTFSSCARRSLYMSGRIPWLYRLSGCNGRRISLCDVTVLSCCWGYLHEVDDGEAVGAVSASVVDPEVEPLCVLCCVQIVAQEELVVVLTPAIQHWWRHKDTSVVTSGILVYTHTWMAFPRFPLSKRDSKTSVSSDSFWSRTLATWQPLRLPPTRDLMYYNNNFKLIKLQHQLFHSKTYFVSMQGRCSSSYKQLKRILPLY